VVQQNSIQRSIQAKGFSSPISFNERLFSRWFKIGQGNNLKVDIDTQRNPKNCQIPDKYSVYLWNADTQKYQSPQPVTYEVDRSQTFTWTNLRAGSYQLVLRVYGTVGQNCKIDGTLTTNEESANDSIVPVARSYRNNTSWAFSANRPPYGKNTNKCNLFVYEILNEAGASVSMKTRDRGFLKGLFSERYVKHPPLAGQWANPGVSIPGWRVVSTPQPGDVVAEASQGNNYTGHVGIVSEVNNGGQNGKTVSASHDKVVENDWGFRSGQNMVFRRYQGR
jgi:hypothetical protein